jgi:hypothetical protein
MKIRLEEGLPTHEGAILQPAVSAIQFASVPDIFDRLRVPLR